MDCNSLSAHPLRGPCQEQRRLLCKGTGFFLQGRRLSQQHPYLCRSFFRFFGVSFPAPVTHQDLGLVGRTVSLLDPFRSKRTRKSSAPCHVQMVFHRSYGLKPAPWWLTTWAVKILLTFYAGWNGLPIRPGGSLPTPTSGSPFQPVAYRNSFPGSKTT